MVALTGDFLSYVPLFRFIVCGICAYLAVSAYQRSKLNWVWVFGALTVLYNPLVPIRLKRDVWSDVYVATIALFIFLLWLLVRANKPPQEKVSKLPRTEDAVANFLTIYVNKAKHEEAVGIHDCQCCGQTKRTLMAVFVENVSYFFARSERRFEGYVCFPCMAMTFVIYEARTLFFTWWGFFGIALGPGYLLWNVYEFLGRSYRFATAKNVKST